ncbi:MAG: IS200/IS605 family transposase, partial [Thermodesulfovibrionales bacterium]|nr:IS200/IS605 family transposase [Thermodesulfovibrionales bacterium]
MAGTFTQIYIHLVFSVKPRKNIIKEIYRDEIEKYIVGIINNLKCKVYAIYCNPDHIHILVSIHPQISISDLVRMIKNNSSKFINQKGWFKEKFNWQDGYGAFSYSQSHVDRVCKYILNQPNHHKKYS